MPELPIACTLTPDALRARREGLLMGLVQHAEHREETARGTASPVCTFWRDDRANRASCGCRTALLPLPSIRDHS